MKSMYWQKIRGICILAVILIHCPAGEKGSSLYVWLFSRHIINFTVALFIFMAGYFTNFDKIKKENYMKKRILRLVIPFLVWDSLYAVKNVVFNNGLSWKRFVLEFLTGKTAAPLYYILVLIQLTILAPWIIEIRQSERGKWIYMITPIYLVALYIYTLIVGKQPFLYETLFPAWFIFYLAGLDCRRGAWDKFISKANISWVVGALGISLLESFVLMKAGAPVGFLSSQIRFGNFIYAIFFIAWIKKRECVGSETVLSRIGDCSFGIYFIHIFVMQVIQKKVNALQLNQVWGVYWIICFFLTAVLSYYVVKVTRKIMCNRRMLKIIGFD